MTAGQRVLVGLDIGASKIAGVVFGGRKILAHERRPIPPGARAGAIIALAAEMAKMLMAERRGEPRTVPADGTGTVRGGFKSVGAGVPGVVSSDHSRIEVATNLPALNHLELPRLLAEQLGLPVVMDNDVHAAALGEARYGTAGSSFVFIAIGSGIGGAIVLDGKVLQGAHGSAGEVGHLVVGDNQTFEQVGSQQALAGTPFPTGERLAAALASGDERAHEIAQRIGAALGVDIGNLINILDPACIVLGGGMAHLWPHFEPSARAAMTRVVISPASRAIPIRLATFGDWAGAVGAAALTSE